MKKLLFILLIIPFFAGAVEILPIPKQEGFFAKIWRCKLSISCYREPKLGVSLTTITGSTLISDLDTIIMANDNALNAGKIENSTTSVASITTLSGLTSASSLATVGTITTGVWNGTILTVGYGGTGSSTLSANQVLLGNGTTQLKVVAGLGTSGQFLQSQGAGNPPIWATSAINEAANYSWTGLHSWSATTTFTATTTLTAGSVNAWAIATSSSLAPWLKFDSSNFRIGIATSAPATTFAVNGNMFISGSCLSCISTTSVKSAGEGIAINNVTITTNGGSGNYTPVASFADAATAEWMVTFTVPKGAIAIAQVKMVYIREVAANLIIDFHGRAIDMDNTSGAIQTDNSTNQTVTVGGVDGNMETYIIPSSAYDGLTFDEGDLIGIAIDRSGSDAGDTYNAAWKLSAVSVSFR